MAVMAGAVGHASVRPVWYGAGGLAGAERLGAVGSGANRFGRHVTERNGLVSGRYGEAEGLRRGLKRWERGWRGAWCGRQKNDGR